MEKYLKDFKLHNKFSSEIIEKYRQQVPNEIMDLVHLCKDILKV